VLKCENAERGPPDDTERLGEKAQALDLKQIAGRHNGRHRHENRLRVATSASAAADVAEDKRRGANQKFDM